MRSSEGGALAIEQIIVMISLLAFLFVAVAVFLNVQSTLQEVGATTFSCWFSMAIKQGVFIDMAKELFPNSCKLQAFDKPVDERVIVRALRNTWYMRGRGNWDEGAFDKIFVAFSFIPVKDMRIMELFNYTKNTQDGIDVKSVIHSDYAYLQKGSKGQSICFHKKIMLDDGQIIKKGVQYYIAFYDDADADDMGDKLIISTTPNLKNEDEYPVHCDSPETGQEILILGYPHPGYIGETFKVVEGGNKIK
ncbi:hypothetical protein HY501_01990 [Candidatus Woesearchaeota archaeon]|nr:hypothetical protein [Candidatus Woesearchaeota archaeon]